MGLASVRLPVLVLVMAACGRAATPATPRASGPTCAAVADHLVFLAEADNQAGASDELAAGIRGEAEHQCAAEPWSTARRVCLKAAATQDDTLACPQH